MRCREGTRLRWWVAVGVAVLSAHGTSSCVFDCFNASLPCVGNDVALVNYTFEIGNLGGAYNAEGEFVGYGLGEYWRAAVIDLRGRGITGIAPDGLGCWTFNAVDVGPGDVAGALLDNNPLGSLPNGSVFYSGAETTSPFGPGAPLRPLTLYLSLVNCSITGLQASDFDEYPGFWGQPNIYSATSSSLYMYMAHNSVTSLSFNLFQGWQGQQLWVDLSSNGLRDCDAIFFAQFQPAPTVFSQTDVILRNNSINSTGLAAIIGSYQIPPNSNAPTSSSSTPVTATAALRLDVSFNNVTELPAGTLGYYGTAAPYPPCLTLNVSHNPLQSLDQNAFASVYAQVLNLTIDLSDSTAGRIRLPSPLYFHSMQSPLSPVATTPFHDRSTLHVIARRTGFTPADVASFNRFLLPTNPANTSTPNGGCGPGCNLTIDLSDNDNACVGNGAFGDSRVTRVVMRRNGLTYFADNAFSRNFELKELDLSDNVLHAVPAGLFATAAALQRLDVNNAGVRAVPTLARYPQAVSMNGNPLRCRGFTSMAFGCGCVGAGGHNDKHCGYNRCTTTTDGCPPGTMFNSSECDAEEPWRSTCVVPGEILGEQYYSSTAQVFEPVAQCASAFPRPDGSGYLDAYQFADFTVTSNRLCSICSTCPTGYATRPCTPTSNTECTKEYRLSVGEVVAIVLSVLMVVCICAIIAATMYQSKKLHKRKLGETTQHLALTERLLGDEREEKERMDHAWRIGEDDIAFGVEIGSGANGRVFKGTWGHIPVAIKVLRRPIDECDPSLSEDFEREVSLMRSIRHPNLLTFFGAGTDRSNRAFLVTELMARGSLKQLLRDQTQPLPWPTRLQFAIDVAAGMRYLHKLGMVHRDLKADNCFVDSKWRVKVADFGAGRIASKMNSGDAVALEISDSLDASTSSGADSNIKRLYDRTLSKGIGTLLWMAPEALRGDRITASAAQALDIYSFAIVLWEIWARRAPWNEIKDEGIQFCARLEALVTSGVRPQLPADGDDRASERYVALMTACWAANPADRPPFWVSLERLDGIRRGLRAERPAGAHRESVM